MRNGENLKSSYFEETVWVLESLIIFILAQAGVYF